MKKAINKNKGFTLIELLIVVAIIGMLSAIVLGNLNASKEKSRDAQRIQTIRQIQTALELYRTDTGSYPNQDVSTASWPTGMETILDGYLSDIPDDPSGLNVAYYGTKASLFVLGCDEAGNGDFNNPLYEYLLTFETESSLSDKLPVLYTLSNPVDNTSCATNK